MVVTVGSGGVGKTTTAAALAVQAAASGRRVLCLTIDPAKRLANSLGLDAMTTEEQVVDPALFAANGLECKGHLSAMMLDSKKTFDDLVRDTASSPDKAQRILDNRIYHYVSSGLAGVQEYMAMEKLYAVREDDRFDLIVLDTPPTSNALDFLDAPERMVEAIDSPAMRWFIEAMDSSGGRFSMGILGKGAGIVMKGLSKLTGAGFLEQVAEFVGGLNDLFGGFRSRAAAVSGVLRSPEVAFVVVTSPAPMAIREAFFFSDRLRELGMRRDGVVVNGVHYLLSEPSAKEETLRAAVAEALPEVDPDSAVDRMSRALEDERLRAVADRIESDRLRARVGKETTFVEVPAFEEDVHDLRALARVASHLVAAA
ncbi:MAG: anion-transporting ATPase [Sandaracinus sp.]|nr:anion-transporting ATPase [Sandaracinus sp.]